MSKQIIDNKNKIKKNTKEKIIEEIKDYNRSDIESSGYNDTDKSDENTQNSEIKNGEYKHWIVKYVECDDLIKNLETAQKDHKNKIKQLKSNKLNIEKKLIVLLSKTQMDKISLGTGQTLLLNVKTKQLPLTEEIIFESIKQKILDKNLLNAKEADDFAKDVITLINEERGYIENTSIRRHIDKKLLPNIKSKFFKKKPT